MDEKKVGKKPEPAEAKKEVPQVGYSAFSLTLVLFKLFDLITACTNI